MMFVLFVPGRGRAGKVWGLSVGITSGSGVCLGGANNRGESRTYVLGLRLSI